MPSVGIASFAHDRTIGRKAHDKSKLFKNVFTRVDGKFFHSRAEALRYTQLCVFKNQGILSALRTQVVFDISNNPKKQSQYIADFVFTNAHGTTIVEDVKTPALAFSKGFIFKKEILLKLYGYNITVVFPWEIFTKGVL